MKFTLRFNGQQATGAFQPSNAKSAEVMSRAIGDAMTAERPVQVESLALKGDTLTLTVKPFHAFVYEESNR